MRDWMTFCFNILLVVVLSLVFLPKNLYAECGQTASYNEDLEIDQLADLNYEDLLAFDLRVTSPSKKEQKYSEVASALYVLTHQDIKRSGAKHIGDLLRLVPGLSVAQINNNQWAISSRGFNQRFSNKLLVLVDGQVVFTPGFNGVYWEQIGAPLENIARVEVIRGPGAAVWGSNAVNGVINIITCDSANTQGTQVSASSGSEELGSAFIRHGDTWGEDTHFRMYANHRTRDENVLTGRGDARDDFNISTGGLRIDSELSNKDDLILKAEGFYLDHDEVASVPSIVPPFTDSETFSGRRKQYGTNLLSRWNHDFSEKSKLQAQADYLFERQDGKAPPITRHTLHLDVQHHYSGIKGHDFVYGVESRFYQDEIKGTFADDFDPEKRGTDLHTFFINDEITLVEDRLNLILGTKFEKNVHTGFEYMPNARVAFTPNDRHTIWGAVSRAVSNPSRTFEDVTLPAVAFPDETSGLPSLVTVFGSRDLKAEDLLAYEMGYRSRVTDTATVDIAVFYNDYNDITSAEPRVPFVGSLRDQDSPALIIPLSLENRISAQSYGVEMAVEIRPYEWWKLVSTYSFISLNADVNDSLDISKVLSIEEDTPQSTATLRSYLDFPYDISFDTVFRYTDSLSALSVNDYLELDARLAWQASEDVEVALVGKNLLNDEHKEFESQVLSPFSTEIERSVFGTVTVSF